MLHFDELNDNVTLIGNNKAGSIPGFDRLFQPVLAV